MIDYQEISSLLINGNDHDCHSFASRRFLVFGCVSPHTEEGGQPMTYTATSLAIAFVVTSFCYWLMMPLMR
ncbi:hypothetical protein SynNOUM97013_01021 [Synechococcus sp. NOUM97013]|nr:hypothetical protein SynNOUM97013_01021 [Synechococcus sp. NOUM97013]